MFDNINYREFNNLLQTNPSNIYSFATDEYITSSYASDLMNVFTFTVDLISQIIIIGIEIIILFVKNLSLFLYDIFNKLGNVNITFKDGLSIYFMVLLFIMVGCLLDLNIEINKKIKNYTELELKIEKLEKKIDVYQQQEDKEEKEERYFGNGRYSKRQRREKKNY